MRRSLDRLQLALQLRVALPALPRQRAVGERLADRAAGLLIVGAVGEAAAPRDLLDVAEGLLEVGVPELQLAHPGRVEDDAAAGQQDQLAVGRRVPARLVVLAHLLRREQLLADERVDDRRLADAGRAEQHGRAVALEPVAQLVDPLAGLRRDGLDRARAERHRLDLGEVRRDVVDEVGLRQQHDGLRAALPRHREVALEPAHVEVERQRLHEERDVDVRREDLLADGCRAPPCARSTVRRGSSASIRPGRRVDADPVADGRQVVLADEAVGRARAQLADLAEQVVGAPVLNRDAGGLEPGGAVLGERGLPAVVPPEPVKQRIRNRKCQPMLLCVRGSMNGRAARQRYR